MVKQCVVILNGLHRPTNLNFRCFLQSVFPIYLELSACPLWSETFFYHRDVTVRMMDRVQRTRVVPGLLQATVSTQEGSLNRRRTYWGELRNAGSHVTGFLKSQVVTLSTFVLVLVMVALVMIVVKPTGSTVVLVLLPSLLLSTLVLKVSKAIPVTGLGGL
jgi:hypothetical protein